MQYVTFAKEKGTSSYRNVEKLIKSAGYNGLTNEEKLKAVGYIYDYATAVAKTIVSDYKPTGWIKEVISSGGNPVQKAIEKAGK